jgi:ribonuclease HII
MASAGPERCINPSGAGQPGGSGRPPGVAGVDEAGRGPLAGPLLVAAVAAPNGLPPGVDDSKRLSPARRAALCAAIIRTCAVGVAVVPAATIDASDIRRATHLGMRQAILALPVAPDAVLIDGDDPPAGLPMPVTAIVGGDRLEPLIGAASIVAKVLRDRLMERLDAIHPGYGFAAHKGYPTVAHRRLLALRGPSAQHRLSFAPVRAALAAARPSTVTS